MALPAFGEGDEYELRGDVELIHADVKTLAWREHAFGLLGFSKHEAALLAERREADLRDIERWLAAGCTHAQVLAIVAPLKAVYTDAG